MAKCATPASKTATKTSKAPAAKSTKSATTAKKK